MKKQFVFILALCLVVSLTACAKPSDSSPTESTSADSAIDPNAIYHDMLIRYFTYSETLEKQESGVVTKRIFGHEMKWDDFTSGNSAGMKVHYDLRLDKEDSPYHSRLYKYDGEDLLWSVRLEQFSYDGKIALPDGVLVYGHNSRSSKSPNPSLMKFNADGELLWKYVPSHPELLHFKVAVANTDGSYAVFGVGWHGDNQCLSLTQVSADGKELLFKINEIGNNKIRFATRVGDDYWLRIGRDEFAIIRMDYNGNITDSISLEEENVNYNIKQILEFNGKVYLSAVVSPKIAEKRPDSNNSQSHYDISALCKDLLDKEHEEYDKAIAEGTVNSFLSTNFAKAFDITDRVKNHYTAILVVCDASTGVPLEFYSARESIGGKLIVTDDGMLSWDIQHIVKAELTPYLGSQFWGADYQVYRCIFDLTGKPICQEIIE